MPSVTNVFLNLTAAIGLEPMAHQWLAPSRRRVAELWPKHIVIGRGQKAHVDLPFFATPDTVNRSAHIVVDPALWNAAEYAEAMPMGIKQHPLPGSAFLQEMAREGRGFTANKRGPQKPDCATA